MRKGFLSSVLLLAVLLIAACGGAATPAAEPTPEGEPAEGVEIVTPSNPTPEEEELDPRGVEDVTNISAQVLEQLAAQTGLALDSFTVSDVTEQEWPNAGLGCPQPDQSYIEVITPGYQFTIQGGDETFDVRTNADGSAIVICDESGAPLSVPEESGSGGGRIQALPEGLSHIPVEIADEMGLEASDLMLVGLEATEWSDSSLGCPNPAEMYMQVITPGYILQFETPVGEVVEVHASQDGNFVLCGTGNDQPVMDE
jgi:hypothetical protein